MSSQKGNVAKKGPPKHQNKGAWKNVYHDTSKKSKQIATTDVSGVCRRCKDVIDWKIKYKKYKLLTQPKTCVTCKEKTVKNSYHVYCIPCVGKANICAKCGESKDIVTEASKTEAEQASEDRQLQFELELLPERKRRTFMRLQEQGKLTNEALKKLEGGDDDFEDDEGDLSDDDEDIKEDMAVCDSSDVNNDEVEACKGEIRSDEIKTCDNIKNRLDNENCDVKCDEVSGGDNNVNENSNKGSSDMATGICQSQNRVKTRSDKTVEDTDRKPCTEKDAENETEQIAEMGISDITDS